MVIVNPREAIIYGRAAPTKLPRPPLKRSHSFDLVITPGAIRGHRACIAAHVTFDVSGYSIALHNEREPVGAKYAAQSGN